MPAATDMKLHPLTAYQESPSYGETWALAPSVEEPPSLSPMSALTMD